MGSPFYTIEGDIMKIVLVTGGTSGIGLACCRAFAQKGYKVYSMSRRPNPMLSSAIQLSVDITNETAVIEAVNQIINKESRIDILVNNAGFGISGAIENTSLVDAKKQFEVNFFGTFIVTKAVIPNMRKIGGGAIINISSVAADVPIPFQAFYSASKAAINSFTMSLANELAPFNIKVKAVMPGDVNTGFTAARDKNMIGSDVYSSLKKSVETMEKDEQNGMRPEEIAKEVVKVAEAKSQKPFSTVGPQYKAVLLASRILPKGFCNKIVGKLYM